MNAEKQLAQLEPQVSNQLSLFVERLKSVYAERLIGIMLFGSAARGAYVPKKSNLNLLVAMNKVGPQELLDYRKIRQEVEKPPFVAPLFLDPDYVRFSADSFPLEFLDIHSFHILLFGKSILEQVAIDPKLLRLQLEREVKGKLLRARQAFLETNGDLRRLSAILSHSFTALRVIFFGMVYLKESRVVAEADELIQKVGKDFGLDTARFLQAGRARTGELKASAPEMEKIFFDYLEELGKLAGKLDLM